MARRPTKLCNKLVRRYLKLFDDIWDTESYESEIEDWLDDIIRGATGQMPGTQRISSYKIFCLLSTLKEISTESVSNILNPRQIAITGNPYSQRTIEYYTAVCRCASQGIFHQLFIRHMVPDLEIPDIEEPEVEEVETGRALLTDDYLFSICSKYKPKEDEEEPSLEQIAEYNLKNFPSNKLGGIMTKKSNDRFEQWDWNEEVEYETVAIPFTCPV